MNRNAFSEKRPPSFWPGKADVRFVVLVFTLAMTDCDLGELRQRQPPLDLMLL